MTADTFADIFVQMPISSKFGLEILAQSESFSTLTKLIDVVSVVIENDATFDISGANFDIDPVFWKTSDFTSFLHVVDGLVSDVNIRKSVVSTVAADILDIDLVTGRDGRFFGIFGIKSEGHTNIDANSKNTEIFGISDSIFLLIKLYQAVVSYISGVNEIPVSTDSSKVTKVGSEFFYAWVKGSHANWSSASLE